MFSDRRGQLARWPASPAQKAHDIGAYAWIAVSLR